jgi:hypothetical protein
MTIIETSKSKDISSRLRVEVIPWTSEKIEENLRESEKFHNDYLSKCAGTEANSKDRYFTNPSKYLPKSSTSLGLS